MEPTTTTTHPTDALLPDSAPRPYTGSRDERQAAVMRGREESRARRMYAALFLSMFTALLGAGVYGFTTLQVTLTGIQEQIGDLQSEVGELRAEMHREIAALSERMARIEAVLADRLPLPEDDERCGY